MNIGISLLGTGLGDQIEAEPVIRYAIKHDFKNHNVIVSTNYPDIFSHLKDKIQVLHNEDLTSHSNMILFKSIPDSNHPIYKLIKPLWCIHPVDWLSLILLNRLIPDKNKRIYLEYDKLKISQEILNSSDGWTLLIHPGVNDIFRTFPNEYWLHVIDKMSQIGWVEQITIIGKTIGDKGCNDFKIGSIENIKKVKINDLRDKTSLNDLFYLVDKCGLLVTNDSGPMHISGAYNSDLIVLNSLKDPAYILPYHDSTTSFKCCEQKKLIADDFDISMFNPCRCDRPVLKDNILNYAPNIVEFC